MKANLLVQLNFENSSWLAIMCPVYSVYVWQYTKPWPYIF